MMGDNKLGHGNRNQAFDAGPANSKIDLYLRSESPRVQQMLLYQNLKEEIEKNPNRRVRYVDSELYFRNQDRSPASGSSEVQSTTLNIGIAPSVGKQNSRIPINSNSNSTATATNSRRDPVRETLALDNPHQNVEKNNQRQAIFNKNCQVCLIKEVRQDLMDINKIVQERNEEISKLKAKCLRSYFERQMMD